MTTLRLKFDPNQKHQLDAVESIVRLFEGLPRRAAEFTLGGEIVPNLPPFESLSEAWLFDNLRQVRQDNNLPTELAGGLEVDEGLVTEGAGSPSRFALTLPSPGGRGDALELHPAEGAEAAGFS